MFKDYHLSWTGWHNATIFTINNFHCQPSRLHLVAGVHATCSFQNPYPLAPCSFQFFSPSFFLTFCFAPYSFSTALCSFVIFLLAPAFFLSRTPCSFWEFSSAPSSFLSFLVLLASGLSFLCSLLLYLFYGLLLVPLCQICLAPCSGITLSGGSVIGYSHRFVRFLECLCSYPANTKHCHTNLNLLLEN